MTDKIKLAVSTKLYSRDEIPRGTYFISAGSAHPKWVWQRRGDYIVPICGFRSNGSVVCYSDEVYPISDFASGYSSEKYKLILGPVDIAQGLLFKGIFEGLKNQI